MISCVKLSPDTTATGLWATDMRLLKSLTKLRLLLCLFPFCLVLVGCLGSSRKRHPDSQILAATPPMGWNSWDAYGESVDEKDIRDAAEFMAGHLKSHGWQYVVVDMGWYVTNHSSGTNSNAAQFAIDPFGRYTPAANTFPSAAGDSGFKPLAAYVHSLGLKFGIHILRGIPREAVSRNLPIEGSRYHAADAANTADTCPWNPFTYGLDSASPAAQAYYDSVARLYADWGVDFLKVDCIASHPYKPEEIRMIAEALRKTGRPIVLSLSPGPAPPEHARDLAKYAQMWRISDDVWDLWHSDSNFPQGVGNQLERAAEWAPFSGPGHWPDADMLPLGSFRPAPGWGPPRETRLTREEQRTLVTLWSIFRSPLILGGNILALADDSWTAALLTNDEVLAVDQLSKDNHAVVSTATSSVWTATPGVGTGYYVAVFNLEAKQQTLRFAWPELGLPAATYRMRDLWQQKDLSAAGALSAALPPHGCALYRIASR